MLKLLLCVKDGFLSVSSCPGLCSPALFSRSPSFVSVHNSEFMTSLQEVTLMLKKMLNQKLTLMLIHLLNQKLTLMLIEMLNHKANLDAKCDANSDVNPDAKSKANSDATSEAFPDVKS